MTPSEAIARAEFLAGWSSQGGKRLYYLSSNEQDREVRAIMDALCGRWRRTKTKPRYSTEGTWEDSHMLCRALGDYFHVVGWSRLPREHIEAVVGLLSEGPGYWEIYAGGPAMWKGGEDASRLR